MAKAIHDFIQFLKTNTLKITFCFFKANRPLFIMSITFFGSNKEEY